METTIGPPLSGAFGSIYSYVIASPPVQYLLASPLLILIIGLVLGIVPISFPMLHGAFNKNRAWFTRSAIKESSLYPKQETSTHMVTQIEQPKPEDTTTKVVTQSVPEVASVPEEKPKEEAPVEA